MYLYISYLFPLVVYYNSNLVVELVVDYLIIVCHTSRVRVQGQDSNS